MFDNKYPYTDFHELNLDWFLAEFKKVMDDNISFKADMTEKYQTMDATVQQFTNFVTNYFDNLDVQEEVNTKLNEMAQDGTLSELIQPLFDEYKEEIDRTVGLQNQSIETQNEKIEILEGRMDEFTHLTDGSTTGDAELADIRIGANGITYPTAGDAVRGQCGQLFNDVEDIKDAIDTELYSKTEIPYTWTAGSGVYSHTGAVGGNATIVTTSNSRYTLILGINEGDVYYFKGYATKSSLYAPVIFTDNSNVVTGIFFDDVSPINTPIPETMITAPEGSTQVYINSTTDGTDCKFYSADKIPIKDTVVEDHEAIQQIVGSVGKKKSLINTLANMNDGSDIVQNTNYIGLRKGDTISFYADITEFSSVLIGYTPGTSAQAVKYFGIDDLNIYFYGNTGRIDGTYAHGLTIKNNISFLIECRNDGQADITLISNGVKYTNTINSFTKYPLCCAFAKSVGSTLKNATLSWTCKDLMKDVWVFGDSYCDYLVTRWAYYLNEYKFIDNILLSSFAGSSSESAVTSMTNLLKYATPKYAVWCMGMNDGSDTDENNPSSNWANYRDIFLTMCQENNIIPILATIPTVPSVLNTGKNKWIKTHDYRYIDFNGAVGANASGEWYGNGTSEDMLSPDHVHPSIRGGMSLFSAAITYFPELMINE